MKTPNLRRQESPDFKEEIYGMEYLEVILRNLRRTNTPIIGNYKNETFSSQITDLEQLSQLIKKIGALDKNPITFIKTYGGEFRQAVYLEIYAGEKLPQTIVNGAKIGHPLPRISLEARICFYMPP